MIKNKTYRNFMIVQMVRDLKANKEVTLEGRQLNAVDKGQLCYEYGYEMEDY